MPLPKAPSVLGDKLEDYGPAAVLTKTREKKKRASSAAKNTNERPEDSLSETLTPNAASEAQGASVSQPKKHVTRRKAVTPKPETSESAAPKTPESSSPTLKAKAPKKRAQSVKQRTQATSDTVTDAMFATLPNAAESEGDRSDATKYSAPSTPAPLAQRTTVPEENLRPMKGASKRLNRRAGLSDGRKLFVLDTNVLMHDPLCLFRFEEHDVFIPMTVLEELDNHKKGSTDVARNARSVSRTLDQLTELHAGSLEGGIALSLLGNSEATGKLFIETHPTRAALPEELPLTKADNVILATAKGAEAHFPDRTIVLVSKDINMRIKASVLGIATEDYLSDKVIDDTDMIYSGRTELPADFWSEVEGSLEVKQTADGTVYYFDWPSAQQFVTNECLTVAGDPDFMAAVSRVEGERVEARVLRDYRKRLKVWGIHARNAEQNMALNLLMDSGIDFVTILGQAGTGKTLLTLAAALVQTLDLNRFSEIIITRATVSVGEDIGYLPGTEEEKMAPWMGALEDNLEVLQSFDKNASEWTRKTGMELLMSRIRVKLMNFMRGRTFLKKFLIIDEAQNLSPKQMKTLITRAGPGTKIVCLGNLAQIDTPYLTEGSSGLTYVVDRFKHWPHAATITLTRGERSRLADYAAEAL